MTLLSFLAGNVKIRFLSPRPERIVNAAHRAGVPFRKLVITDSEASFELLSPRVKELEPFFQTLSFTERVIKTESGLPTLLKRYRKRWGYFAGIAIFLASFFLADCFLWGIDLAGTTDDPERVFAALSDVGLTPGIWSRDLDADGMARRFLVLHPEYAYAGIRLVGMRALVELRPAEPLDRTDPWAGYSNLVSSGSGRVLRCEVMSGECLVKPGDLVTTGDLLVSGIRETANGAFLPTRSIGRVFCETQEAFETTVPLEEKRTVFTGREEKKIALFLLGHRFYSTGESGSFQDCEQQTFFEPVSVLGWETPVYRRVTVFSERVEKMLAVDVDRARDLAYDKYIIYKDNILGLDGELYWEEPLWEVRAEEVYLLVRYSAARDLTREVPFTIQ